MIDSKIVANIGGDIPWKDVAESLGGWWKYSVSSLQRGCAGVHICKKEKAHQAASLLLAHLKSKDLK